MLAKGCCGWPRSDRRRRCTVTAGCGHNCSLAGPSKASSRSWCVRIHSLAKRCSCAPSKPRITHHTSPKVSSSNAANTYRVRRNQVGMGLARQGEGLARNGR